VQLPEPISFVAPTEAPDFRDKTRRKKLNKGEKKEGTHTKDRE
jgi:hypothetical protein